MPSPVETLTERQKDCLRLVLTGRSAKQIAAELRISPGTVEQHLKAARRILGVTDSGAAARLLLAQDEAPIQELDIQPQALPQPPFDAQQLPQQQEKADPSDQADSLLREPRMPFDATPEPLRPRDWILRRKDQLRNPLSKTQRLIAITALTVIALLSAALMIIAVSSLMQFLIEASHHDA